MALNALAALSIAHAAGLAGDGARAVDLGNQRLSVSSDALLRIADHKESRGQNEAAGALRELARKPDSERRPLSHAFYAALGFSEYVAIDVNEKFGSIPMDLNSPLRRTYGYEEEFELVVNNGTGEHIFDQRAVFENMHNLCAKDGLMLHIIPFAGFLNHGFYNIQPTLYLDLSAANDYRIEALGIGNATGALGFMAGSAADGLLEAQNIPRELLVRPIEGRAPWGKPPLRWLRIALYERGYYNDPRMNLDRAVLKVMRDSQRETGKVFGNVLMVALLRKTGTADFKVPFQGRFVPNLEDETIASNYEKSSISGALSQ
jgi:hypothetical protein